MKKQRNYLKIAEISLLIGLLATAAWGAWSLHSQQELAERVVRLHILANSDSEADQALKLEVRDAVLARATEILKGTDNRAEAESALRENLSALQQLAEEKLAAEGCDYPVTVELRQTAFPTREYDGFTLPAGKYLALRFVIGRGEGHNWWCVVFPPLCTESTTDVASAAMAAGLSEDDVKLITGDGEGYVLKFKSIELWEKLRAKLAS
jgi:stage II sporulation protein R